MSKLFRSLVWTGFVAIGLAACGDDVTVTENPPPPPPTPGILSVQVGPDGASITVGGTQQMTAAVTLQPGAAAATVVWSTSDAAKATVNSTSGLVTGVTVGSVGIRATATSGTSVGSGVATVHVVAAPTCVVSSVVVTPGSADMVLGQTIQASAAVNGTAQCATTVNWTSLTPAVASVHPTSGLITALTAGSAVIKATSTADASKAGTSAITVRIPEPAKLSIQSVTAGGLPINLGNVLGQIEVALNVDNGEKVLDRVDVLVGGLVVASQTFTSAAPAAAPSAAPVTVVQNVNTRQLAQVGGSLFIPVIFNGQTAVTANLYVVGSSTPIASNAVPVLMNNPDAAIAPAVLTRNIPSPAIANGGFSWTAGGVNSTWNYIAFSNRAPATSFNALACGVQTSAVTGTPSTGLTVANNWTCAGVQSSAVALGAIGATAWPALTTGPDGSALIGPEVPTILPPSLVAVAGYSTVGSSFMVGGFTRWNLITPTPNPLPAAVAIDNVAPVFAGPTTVAFNASFDFAWINAAYTFGNYAGPSDAGSGLDLTMTGTRTWPGSPGACSGITVASGADLNETVTSVAIPDGYRVCGFAADMLGNASTSGVSNYFGVDKVAPASRFIGSTVATPAPAGVASTVSATANTTIYSLAALTPAQVFGVEALDTRSGFHQGGALVGFPTLMSLTYTNVTGTTACAPGAATLPTIMSDTYVRSIELANTCAATPSYYAWSGLVTDRAGNASTPILRNFAKDDLAGPNITGLGFSPGFYTPAAPASFGISANDDLEVIDGTLLVTQPNIQAFAGLRYPFGSLAGLGTRWDAAFSNVLNGQALTIPSFIFRVDGVCTAATVPYASCPALVGTVNTVSAEYLAGSTRLPTAMSADVTDVGSNPSSGAIGPVPMLTTQFSPSTGIAEPWVAADLITWTGSVSGANAVAIHMASTSILVPFFDSVGLWRVSIAGALTYCGVTFPAPTLTDNGLNRFWTYVTPIPTTGVCTGAAFAATTWRAVGFSGGAALVSNTF